MEATSSASGGVWEWSRFREVTNLSKMVFRNVKGLKSLPIDFKALANLSHLDLSGWSDLEKMPDSFTGLSELQYLALQDCKSLSISDLGGLTKLEYLDFEGCSSLQKLPDKTTSLPKLRYLNLMRTSIEELPQDFGKLKNLEQLLITSSYLRTLPSSFRELGQLRILRLVETGISKSCLSILTRIRILDISGCHNLKVLNLEGLRSIEEIEAKDCWNLQILDISGCHNLKALNLEGLRSIEEIAAKDCWNLQILDISGCHNLKVLNLEGLRCIEEIAAKDCWNLQILDISGCHNLKALNLEGLRSIEEIAAKDCWKLQSIQGLAHLGTLSYLNVSTFNEDPNSTIWSEILRFPSNVSTVILGGPNVLCINAEEMDSVKQSILKKFEGATIIDIPTIENLHRVPLRNMELHGAILLCFIAKRNFIEFKLSVGDNVYSIRKPSFVTRAKVYEEHEETRWIYTFMWSQNSNLFKNLTLHGKSVPDCTIELCHGHSGTLNASFTVAWIVMISNRKDGVKICKQLLNSLSCISKQAVHQVVAL